MKNKIVWVTGASSGIGRALCLQLDRLGARLIVSGRNQEALQKLLKESSQGNVHQILAFDMANTEDIEQIASQAKSLFGRVDVLFNNAGISQRSLALETSIEVDRQVMEIDYFATVALTKAILPTLMEQQQSLIVNIASVAGKVGSPLRSAYSGAKHALIGFMDCLRAEVASKGVRVINVCPGFVKTNISMNALTGNMNTYEKMDVEIKNGMLAEDFAKTLIRRLKSSRQEIIIARGLPFWAYQVRRLMPNLYHWVLPKVYNRHQ